MSNHTKARAWFQWIASLFGVWWTLVWAVLGGMLVFGIGGVMYLLTVALTAITIAMAVHQSFVVHCFNKALEGLKIWWGNRPK